MFLVAQSVGKHLIERGEGGSIIQVASTYGIVGSDPSLYEGSHYMGQRMNTPPVYSASKAAVVGLTRYLATNWAAHNIRVNTLVPGGIESGQNENVQSQLRGADPARPHGSSRRNGRRGCLSCIGRVQLYDRTDDDRRRWLDCLVAS